MATLDIGHAGLTADAALEEVAAAIRVVRADPVLRALKLIHGQGHGSGGSIRARVRAWLRVAPVRAVVEGERYEIFDGATQDLRAACDHPPDPDLGRANAGITVVWVR